MLDDLIGDFDFDAPATDFDYATKEGWRQFVDFIAQRPLTLTMTEYDTLSSSERALHNIARERYMTIGARVATPSLHTLGAGAATGARDDRDVLPERRAQQRRRKCPAAARLRRGRTRWLLPGLDRRHGQHPCGGTRGRRGSERGCVRGESRWQISRSARFYIGWAAPPSSSTCERTSKSPKA